MDNPIDVWGEIQKTRATKGWKLLMKRYGKEGDVILTSLLDIKLCNEKKYGIRDLYAYQLNALGKIGEVIKEFEVEAKAKSDEYNGPPHIGV